MSVAPTSHAEPLFKKHYYQIRRIETFNPNQPLSKTTPYNVMLVKNGVLPSHTQARKSLKLEVNGTDSYSTLGGNM